MKATLLSLLLISTLSSPVFAGELADYFDKVETLRANFSQRVIENGKARPQQSSGVLTIQKPDRFLLEYKKPFRQLYIADGENIWSYDEDLEQAIVKKQAGLLQNTPALILTNPKALESDYIVQKELGKDELARFNLKPKSASSNFETLVLQFNGNRLDTMEMHDSFGQVTFLQFSRLQLNPILDENTFNFAAPEGVDVIRADEKL